MIRALFVLAYTCSGFAGLVYEVAWTRLLTLYIGHTTAAASAVVGAFLGGLAVGAAAGGSSAARLTPRRCLQAYALLEIAVAAAALALPFELRAVTPLLSWAYADGSPALLFPLVRLAACLLMVFVPALALGATFPLAIRWMTSRSHRAAQASGTLYAANTAGAAVGALLAGFVLIPAVGVSGATWIGIAGSIAAAACVVAVLMVDRADVGWYGGRGFSPADAPAASRSGGTKVPPSTSTIPLWLPALVLGLSGFASLVHEIAWTRILVLVLGPTTYAFAATLAFVISGVAIGSAAGAWLSGRARRPEAGLVFALALAAVTTSVTYSLAGAQIPGVMAEQLSASDGSFGDLLGRGLLLTAALILPTAICLGAAFSLALAVADDPLKPTPRRFAIIYAVNTIGAVSGSLAAGFLLIPQFGLRLTLMLASAVLVVAALIVMTRATLPRGLRGAGMVSAAACLVILVISPPWDRQLLASGAYLYAPFVPDDLDLKALLRAGELLYYREGAAATVSVKKLTGTTTLAVDGKTDASNRGDMLTQSLVAHLPLLLHENPREIAIIGLGSGVTAGAALRHPITRADVIEISPEVVEASRFFERENHHALADPRTNLIVGDGRSHLLLSQRKYDVIISEPSNPWIAGVAALFTREFFVAARERLTDGGIICQWANAYNISDPDLRAIVATFRSVFPNGTAWLVGGDDVLLVASQRPLEDRLANIERFWRRPGVAEDLANVAVVEPFSVLSLFIGGPVELARYSQGAAILDDDRMTLEFSAPRELHRRAGENREILSALLSPAGGPPVIRAAHAAAGAPQWRNRAAMMARRDAHANAYDDSVRALTIDLADAAALDGFARTAVLTSRVAEALPWLTQRLEGHPVTVGALLAQSKLLAATGARDEAVAAARRASEVSPDSYAAAEQLASLFAEAEDTVQLDAAAERLRMLDAARPATQYYRAVAAFLHGQPEDAAAIAQQAVAADPSYQPVYDLLGAAYTRMGDIPRAREAFLKALALDGHDSTAYTNLGVIELNAGNRDAAARYFAEALWLVPDSEVARQGLAQSLAR